MWRVDAQEIAAQNNERRKRKGQTLAEFAITLPILLLLTFGVIEFGRAFQAWVTLQNSAREAARYASTGAFNADRFPINTDGSNDPASIVPCVYDDWRGTLNPNFRPNDPNDPADAIMIYEADANPTTPDESLFATWWDGRDCEPNRPEHQDMRKDIVRILSIAERARIGAAGLALGPDPYSGVNSAESAKQALYSVWRRPLPGSGQYFQPAGSDQQSYFNVMICSDRAPLERNSSRSNPDAPRRYISVADANDVPAGGVDNRAPVCVMNEIPASSVVGATRNGGKPWLDPGGPGDSVFIVVSFNHPLITPLGLSPYLPLQARRTAVNEAFRVVGLDVAIPPSGITGERPNQAPIADAGPNQTLLLTALTDPDGDGLVEVQLDGSASRDPDGEIVLYRWVRMDTGAVLCEGARALCEKPRVLLPAGDFTLRLTVVDDDTAEDFDDMTVSISMPDPTATNTATVTPTLTSTAPPPFSCDLITVGDISFYNNRVYIQIDNQNVFDSVLTNVALNWRKVPAFANMYLSGMFLNGIAHWAGVDRDPPTRTNADPSTPPGVFQAADRSIYALTTMTWEGVFANGPGLLTDFMTQYDFEGSEFRFHNPTGPECVITLILPTPTPSPTVDVSRPTNTPTWTPDCASSEIQVRFVEFRTFGVVVLEVENRRNAVAPMTDFQFNWIQRAPGIMTLEALYVGGSGPADTVTPTVKVWQSGSTTQDANPPTTGGSTSVTQGQREGTWLTDYTFPPNSLTRMYVDFGGTAMTIQSQFNVQKSDFNGSWFQIGCGSSGSSGGGGSGGSGGGGGGSSSGRINLFNEATPAPTNTPGPTNTPRPTDTPGPTSTPAPPTNTPLPPTITNTPKPSNTPAPPPTNTPIPLPTKPGSGGADG